MNERNTAGAVCGQTQMGQVIGPQLKEECAAVRERTVQEFLQQEMMNAVKRAHDLSKRIAEMDKQDLYLPISEYERKYSLYNHGPF